MKKIRFYLILLLLLFILSVGATALYEDGEGIYSDTVYMENLETGRIIFDIGSEEKVYPASLTKILTCILAIEKCEDKAEVFEIPRGIFDDIYAEGGAHISLKYGETVGVYDLIYATMIRSACDSATALAYYVSGSVEAFADAMNAKAKEIGAENTHFVNAHGLHDDNHYTTARDIAIITKYALQNEDFCDIISHWNHTIPATDMADERYFETTIEIENPEKSTYYPKVTGVKSGFTDQAGRCLVTLTRDGDESYLLVTLGANRNNSYQANMAFTDAVNLHEYAHARYSIHKIINKDTTEISIPVKEGTKESITLSPNSDKTYLCAVDEDLTLEYSVPESITEEVHRGDEIGHVTVTVGDFSLTEPLFAKDGVKIAKDSAVIVTDNTFVSILNVSTIVIYAVSAFVLIAFLVIFFKKKQSPKK